MLTCMLDKQQLESRLKPVNAAGWLETRCMKNTRLDILDEIWTWIDDSLAPNMFLLTADPGAGKTTIASTVMIELLSRGRCVPYFFFKRRDDAHSNPINIWRTIAHSLAQHPLLTEALVESTSDPLALDGPIDVVFNHLIEQPLTKVQDKFREHPLIFVLDALDECDSKHPAYSAFMGLIRDWSKKLPSCYKIIITSRHNEDLVESLGDKAHLGSLATGTRVTLSSHNDICTYIQSKMEEIIRSHRLSPLPVDWGSRENIEKLVAGLFLWASTVMEFISADPERRLQTLLSQSPVGGTEELNALYTQILSTASSVHGNDAVMTIVGITAITKN